MSRDFSGSGSDFYGISNPTGPLDVTGTALTLSAWIQPDAVATSFVISKSASGAAATQYALYLEGTVPAIRIGDGTGVDLVGTAGAATAGVWQHIAGVKNGTGAGALKASLNGAINPGTSNRPIGDSANDFLIGQRNGTGGLFNGRIAEAAVWNVALSDDEIIALSKGVLPIRIRRSNLIAYYPLLAVSATEPDMSGNGQSLVTSGSVPAGATHAPVGPIGMVLG